MASPWTVQLEATTWCGEAACCLSLPAFGLFIPAQLLVCSKTLLCVHFLESVVRYWQLACKPEEIRQGLLGRNSSPPTVGRRERCGCCLFLTFGGDNFRFTEKLQRWYTEFLDTLCQVPCNSNILYNYSAFIKTEQLALVQSVH